MTPAPRLEASRRAAQLRQGQGVDRPAQLSLEHRRQVRLADGTHRVRADSGAVDGRAADRHDAVADGAAGGREGRRQDRQRRREDGEQGFQLGAQVPAQRRIDLLVDHLDARPAKRLPCHPDPLGGGAGRKGPARGVEH
jgi:hypothetical protein